MCKECGCKDEQQYQEDRNGALDIVLSKMTSRKLLVWGFATTFLFMGMINADWWAYISIAYVGTQGFSDIMDRFLSHKR